MLTQSKGDKIEQPARILIVDDEQVLCKTLSLHLSRQGYHTQQANTLSQARELLVMQSGSTESGSTETRQQWVDLILCDWKLGEESGLDLIREVKAMECKRGRLRPRILFMSAHASHQIASKAIDLGADDYIAKPFEISELIFRVERILERDLLERRVLELESNLGYEAEDRLDRMIGRADSMKRIFQLIRRVAPTQSKLLIQGESGTGKELVARAVHQLGLNPHGPFIAVNCAAIPEALVESELFGHSKGAFTHAHTDRVGLIEAANGGTLFLDEIGELSLNIQSKLLRLLQESELRRVGENASIKVKVRVVAATLKDLQVEVGAKRFREDLYYRLNVIPVHLPALRERREDLPLLLNHFMLNISEKIYQGSSKRITSPQRVRLSSQALEVLLDYDWPGNVRELENCVEYALTLVEGDTIHISDLPLRIRSTYSEKKMVDDRELQNLSQSIGRDGLSIKKHTQDLEKRLIVEALKKSTGIKTQAAKSLEISTKTLLYKMRHYNIDQDLL